MLFLVEIKLAQIGFVPPSCFCIRNQNNNDEERRIHFDPTNIEHQKLSTLCQTLTAVFSLQERRVLAKPLV